MTVILQDGEQMETQHGISCRYGRGTLHVTNQRIMIEIEKRGLVFHRQHWQMSNIESRGRNKIKLEWPEQNGQMYDFEFDAGRKHKEIVQKIRRRHPYHANFSRGGITRVIFNEKQRRDIRRKRSKWVSKKLVKAEKKRTTIDAFGWWWRKGDTAAAAAAGMPALLRDHIWSDDAEMWRRTLLDVQDDLKVARSSYVPKSVENYLCWNDCWLVEQSWPDKSYYHTLNYYWTSRRYKGARIKGGRFDEETGAYCIPAEHVRFYHGYPYVRGDAFENPLYRIGFFIPTILDEMADEEIVRLRWRPYDARHVWGSNQDEADGVGLMADLGHFTDAAESVIPINNNTWRVTPRISEYLYRWAMFVDPALGRKDARRYGPQPTMQEIAERRGVPIDTLVKSNMLPAYYG